MPTEAQKAEWQWHLWRKDLKTGLKSYCGFFYDEKGALATKKKKAEENPGFSFAVTNYGPLDLAKRAEKRPVVTQVQHGRPATSSAASKAMEEARAESRRRDAENIKKRAEKKAKDDKRKAEDRAMMTGIRKDADEIMEQHKADEQADLDAGINR